MLGSCGYVRWYDHMKGITHSVSNLSMFCNHSQMAQVEGQQCQLHCQKFSHHKWHWWYQAFASEDPWSASQNGTWKKYSLMHWGVLFRDGGSSQKVERSNESWLYYAARTFSNYRTCWLTCRCHGNSCHSPLCHQFVRVHVAPMPPPLLFLCCVSQVPPNFSLATDFYRI